VQNNEILERFSLVEQEAKEAASYLETVRDGSNIVFRLSKRAARTLGIVKNVGFVGCAVILSSLILGLFCPPVPTLVSAFLWSMVLCLWALLLWMAVQTRATFTEQPIYFEIDVERECIVNREYGGKERSLKISDLYCFYAWHTIEGSDHHSAIYAVDKKDEKTVLMHEEISDEVTERNAQLLGFLCNKPAFKRDTYGKIYPLPDFTPAHRG
jgi:hypothetical protein